MSATFRQVVALSRRSLVNTIRQPQFVVPSLFFPLFFAALNVASFNKSTHLPGFPQVDSFLDFMLAATVVQGVLFGATVLALATSLPEISTGLQAVRQGDDNLAISDIFGGNAFLPPLFLLASAIAGKAVLPSAQASDVYLAGLGILLTVVYVYGLLFRPRRRVLGMGLDSLACLVLYAVGIAGLVALAAG